MDYSKGNFNGGAENNNGIPTFTPPTGDIPTFTPPSDNGIPTFTPPGGGAPTFEPPKNTFSGPSCHFHNDEPSVARCAKCGKHICQDCYDNYGVSSGDYVNQALCYDCCSMLVDENIRELKKNKRKIKFQFILSIIGMVIGFILGVVAGSSGGVGSALLVGLIYAGIGGVFLSFMKFYFSVAWEFIKDMFSSLASGAGVVGIIFDVLSMVIKLCIGVVQSIYYTIVNTIYYIKYLKETSGFIESDTAALAQMKDYMEYTLIRNRNRGVDIETLLSQQSDLADNTYANMVKEKGEEGAEAAMRECVATINENGEIIRSFRTVGQKADEQAAA